MSEYVGRFGFTQGLEGVRGIRRGLSLKGGNQSGNIVRMREQIRNSTIILAESGRILDDVLKQILQVLVRAGPGSWT